MNTNKGDIVKESGKDVEGYRSQMVLCEHNVRVFLQYFCVKHFTCFVVQVVIGLTNEKLDTVTGLSDAVCREGCTRGLQV